MFITWFKKHQRLMVWFANTKYGRSILRIKKDVPAGKKIIKILPNCFTWDNNDGTYSTDFRTHNKFARRIYHAFKLYWWCLHFIDWLVLDRFIPKLSFGFASLTKYPDADPESTTIDGVVKRVVADQTWAQLRDGAGTLADSNSATTPSPPTQGSFSITHYSTAPWRWYGLGRLITLFDTSSLPDAANITAAVYSLDIALATNNGLDEGDDEMNITECSPASNVVLATSDFNIANWSNILLATGVDKDNMNGNGSYTDWTLNLDGRNAINKTGVTKLGCRFEVDILDSEPLSVIAEGGQTIFWVRTADYSGEGSDPKLVVTYETYHKQSGMLMGLD